MVVLSHFAQRAGCRRLPSARLWSTFPTSSSMPAYEKVREAGIVMSQAVLIAVGIAWDGRRQILAVEMANRESRSVWRDFLVGLKRRGLKGVELVVSDDHAGLVAAIGEVIPEAAWQRCYVHFLRNALDHLRESTVTTACRN